jgi:hypothetical protein
MAVPALARHGMDAIVLVNWGCLVVTLVTVECVLRWREIVPAGQRKALRQASEEPALSGRG